MESPVAIILLLANVGASLYAWYGNPSIFYSWALTPAEVYHKKSYYQVITSGFIHADFAHLLFNMVSFFFFGFPLERAIGSLNFLIVYLGALILSDISTILKHRNDPDYRSIGASGAVSGVIFGLILFAPTSMLYVFFIPMPAWLFAILYLVFSQYAAKKRYDMINHDAHFWGAVAGLLLTVILVPESISIFIDKLFG